MDTAAFARVLAAYWSGDALAVNLLIFLNLAGALLLGSLVGYERAYRGRAAGMRTYGLVCMASTALTVFAGYPALWYGGQASFTTALAHDPTRVIQGIVTGIGFLGAGVIMKDGLNISGLTTAASIWSASAIGVLIGVGFYGAAILLAALSASAMMWGSRIEAWLPSHQAVGIELRLRAGVACDAARIDTFLRQQGFTLATGSLAICHDDGQSTWKFVAVVQDRHHAAPLDRLAAALQGWDAVQRFSLAHARN
jgi:putative Mg2+ transporter-C (MgtC) family protein